MKNELQKLHEVVTRSKVTCLVLWPLDKPIPLSRSWCIFEIAKTALSPATRLNVSFPPSQVDCLKEKFRDPQKIRTIRDIISNINSEEAEATVAKDKKD